MEPVRPKVDFYLLALLRRGPLNRNWFLEQRDGNCRLVSSLASELSETANIWRQALAPFAEGIARSLWTMTSGKERSNGPSTRLTQSRKREAKGIVKEIAKHSESTVSAICRICGTQIKCGLKYCVSCVPTITKENILEASKLGRLATHTPQAQARRSETKRRQDAALKTWNPSDKPEWLDLNTYQKKVQPLLIRVIVPKIMSALRVSEPYGLRIRSGGCIPHPRHWSTLAQLVNVSSRT
jgi:hypothetical protein